MPKADVSAKPTTISAINLLPYKTKREIYKGLVPEDIYEKFSLSADLYDSEGNDLITLKTDPGHSDAEIYIYHKAGFTDPILYGHISDTLLNQIHILLYVINNPDSQRFNVDRMPDGTPTLLGAVTRNLDEELLAFQDGLSPGQVRHGMRLMLSGAKKFEEFVQNLGHSIYFVEPLYYHNAVLFERYGFAYQRGRKLMEEINEGFQPKGSLTKLLDSSTPFRAPNAGKSIRKRSWAIHDGILGKAFSGVTMYKRIGISSGLNTTKNCEW